MKWIMTCTSTVSGASPKEVLEAQVVVEEKGRLLHNDAVLIDGSKLALIEHIVLASAQAAQGALAQDARSLRVLQGVGAAVVGGRQAS